MRSIAVYGWHNAEGIQINRHHRIDGIDQRHRICSASLRSAGGRANTGHVGCQLYNHGKFRKILTPCGNHLDILGDLPYGSAHAPFRHAVRTAKVKFNAIGTGIFNLG